MMFANINKNFGVLLNKMQKPRPLKKKILTYKHYYYTYLLTSSVKQIIVVDELVVKLTNTL